MSPKIREIEKNGKTRFEVDCGTQFGRRKRLSFQSLLEARSFAKNVTNAEPGEIYQTLTQPQKVTLNTILTEIEAKGCTLVQVWDEYKKHVDRECPLVEDAITHYMADRRKRKLKPKYADRLEGYLYKLASRYPDTRVDRISSEMLQDFIYQDNPAPGTVVGYRGMLSGFFTHARKHRWITHSPIDLISKPIIDRCPPKIFTVEKAGTLLNTALAHDPELTAYLCLCLFCGLRVEEAQALKNPDIRWEHGNPKRAGRVIIQTDISKTRRRRLVDMPPIIRKWREAAQEAWTPYEVPTNLRKRLLAIREAAKIEWPHDVMRHSAASYMVAFHKNANETALQLGHSVPVLFQHYREMVTFEDAERFYSLEPKKKLFTI